MSFPPWSELSNNQVSFPCIISVSKTFIEDLMGTVLWVECFFLFLEFNRMSRYEKSYRHINSQCEKKQKVIFSFRFWKRRRVCVRERERETLPWDLRTIKTFCYLYQSTFTMKPERQHLLFLCVFINIVFYHVFWKRKSGKWYRI